jgi:hypothetical protein
LEYIVSWLPSLLIMSDSPYIPPHPFPAAPESLENEQNARRRSSRIAAQCKEARSIDLCSTGSAAKNELLKRTSRSKASSKRSVSVSSNQRIPTPTPTVPHTGLALTEDNLLAHVSMTNTPQTRGVGQTQSVQLGNQHQDDETSSSLSLDSENIRYYTEKLRRKRAHEAEVTNAIQTNLTPLNDSDAVNLTTPQLIEKVDQSNPGWQGVESSLSGLHETLRPDYVSPSMFDLSLPQDKHIKWPSYEQPTTPPFNKFVNLDLEKTPRSPAVTRISAEMVFALKGAEKDHNPFHTTTEQQVEEFETSVVMSKVTTDHIINSNFERPSTPTPKIPNKEALSFDEITHIRELWSELATYYSMLRPKRITNFHALAEPAYAFINGYQESAWCDIIVGTNTARNLYSSAPIPQNINMDTNEDHPVPTSPSIPAPAAPAPVAPTPTPALVVNLTKTPPASDPISNWSHTPVPAPAPPAPTSAPHQISNTDFPTLNAAHIKLHKSPIKIGKPKPFANIVPKIAKKLPQPPKGRMEGPISSLIPQIDALGSKTQPKTTDKPTASKLSPPPRKSRSQGQAVLRSNYR